jgi:hypothetical protein
MPRSRPKPKSYRGGGGGVLFLKFNGNDGYYSYGADDTDLPVDSQAAMNPRSLKRGWICWKGGQVQEEIMMSLEEGLPPAKHQLPDYGPYGKDDGWSEQKTIEFKTIDGEGLTLLFQANNKSKMNALEAVMKDFARQYKSNPGCVPIVELGENEFETQPKNEDGSKGRKVRKHAPKFKHGRLDDRGGASVALGGRRRGLRRGRRAPGRGTGRRATAGSGSGSRTGSRARPWRSSHAAPGCQRRPSGLASGSGGCCCSRPGSRSGQGCGSRRRSGGRRPARSALLSAEGGPRRPEPAGFLSPPTSVRLS